MRHYVCSVENGRTVPTEVRRILVPVDFSEASWGALVYAMDLAERHGATVDALHIIDLPPYPAMGQWTERDGDTQALPSFAQHVHELAAQRLDEMLSRATREGVQVSGILDDGEPVPAIAARAKEYDLIVIGAHDDDAGMRGLLFGNVTDRLAGEIDVPMISVRLAEERESRASLG